MTSRAAEMVAAVLPFTITSHVYVPEFDAVSSEKIIVDSYPESPLSIVGL